MPIWLKRLMCLLKTGHIPFVSCLKLAWGTNLSIMAITSLQKRKWMSLLQESLIQSSISINGMVRKNSSTASHVIVYGWGIVHHQNCAYYRTA